MPITPLTKIAHDPQASLAWRTSIVLLALEKIKRNRGLREAEKEAIDQVASQLGLLSLASRVRFDKSAVSDSDPIPANLLDSFFTLHTVTNRSSVIASASVLERAREGLEEISGALKSGIGAVNQDKLEEIQEVCQHLLEHLNKIRPNTSKH